MACLFFKFGQILQIFNLLPALSLENPVKAQATPDYRRQFETDTHLRCRARPIPTNNMWIAASALQHGLAIFSHDGHFHEVPGLTVGTRLADFVY
jgi:predicted nucleic acid-binding protein